MLFLSLGIGTFVAPNLASVIAGYAVVQIAYCLRLKREPLVDLFCIASGFLLRALAGLLATGLGASPWFLLTIGLLALFLAVEKRGASTSWMLLTVPFVLAGIFRYQLLSDPEETERRAPRHPDRNCEKPEEILLGDRGIHLTLLGWLATTCVVGVGHRMGWLS